MEKILRYRISNWSQITQCKSNNSRNLSLSLSKYLDGKILRGLVLSVNHANYGTLFAAMIQGSGILLTDIDDEGYDVDFLTTDEILRQLLKFGFYIEYDIKKNLPNNILVFLNTINDIGFDKVSRVALETITEVGTRIWKPTIVVFKSEFNDDLLKFDCKLSRDKFNEKLANNVIMNVTHEEGMEWDWLNYMANISDLLDENADPTDEFDPERVRPIVPDFHHDIPDYNYENNEFDSYSGDASDAGLTPFGSEEVDSNVEGGE